MLNITHFIDKSIQYFYFIFKQQKLLFFLILLAVALGIYFGQSRFQTLYYGEVDIYPGGEVYFSKLISIQDEIAPFSRLKVDFLSNADIGFGIKESNFNEQTNNSIIMREAGDSSYIEQEREEDLENELTGDRIFSKYFVMAGRTENQLKFFKKFKEDTELLKSYGLLDLSTKFDFHVVSAIKTLLHDDLPKNINSKNSYEFRRLTFGFQSLEKKYIIPILVEYSKYVNNLVNKDIEMTITSYIDSNTKMLDFQKDLLKEQLKILKETYEVLLEDEVVKLQENVLIAQSLGYDKSYFLKEFVVSPNEKAYTYQQHCPIGPTTLYCMGYEALQTKIATLLRRDVTTPFIKGYREIQSALKQLEVASFTSIAETLKNEYNFKEYRDYVRLDELSIRYEVSNESSKFIVVITVLGILSFLLISLITKIYIDQKKLITNSTKS